MAQRITDLRAPHSRGGREFHTARFSKKRPRLRQRRRRARLLGGILFFIFLLILAGGATALTHIPRLQIKDVRVEGAVALVPDEIRARALDALEDGKTHVISRTNMFWYPKNALREMIRNAYPRIQEVHVSRPSLLAQTVVVAIVEREPSSRWCSDSGTCFFMDETGLVFAEAPASDQTGYRFEGGLDSSRGAIGQHFIRGYLREIRILLDTMKARGFDVHGGRVLDEHDFAIRVGEITRILVPFGADPDLLIRNLQTAVGAKPLNGQLENVEHIDLRYGDRVYYKLKSGAVAPPSGE